MPVVSGVLTWQVWQWTEEEKRQHKLVSLLKGQRDIKQTEAVRAQQAEKENAKQVRNTELARNTNRRSLNMLAWYN